MPSSLLKTKFYIPPRRSEWVSRPRLLELLNAGLNRRLTLLSAPAGYGKTSLLSEWTGRSKAPVAWLSLDENDNDPARFLSYLVSALRQIEDELDPGFLAALKSPGPLPLESILTPLINQLIQISTPFGLVLDDYHLIQNPSIHQALTFLLDHLPNPMHLFVATRVDPPLPIARLRARGQLTQLGSADLRFQPEEAGDFLRRIIGRELTGEEVSALAGQTEGWIAGLQLAAVSIKGRPDVRGFIQSFTGSSRYIVDYLLEEVLQRQPEDIQSFLLRTAVLDRLHPALCNAVTARQDSHTVLDKLERDNLFIIPLDQERSWYRYHRLFAELLRKRLEQSHAGQVAQIHRQASGWYEQRGLIPQAIDHALSAGESERAALLIEGMAEASMMRSEVATFKAWVEALPEDQLRSRPLLCIYYAWALLLGGGSRQETESYLQAARGNDPAGILTREISIFQVILAVYHGGAQRSTESLHRALERLPEESPFFRGIVALILAEAQYLVDGDVPLAIGSFERVTKMGQDSGDITTTVLGKYTIAGLYRLKGDLQRARMLYTEAMNRAVDKRGQPLPIAGLAHIGLGKVLFEQNRLAAAAKYMQQGIELVKRWAEIGTLDGYINLAKVKQAQGDWEEAEGLIRQAEEVTSRFDIIDVDDHLVAAHKARLGLRKGDLQAAQYWAERRWLYLQEGVPVDNIGGQFWYELNELERINLARVYLRQDRIDDARQVLETLLRQAEILGRIRSVMEILILLALAHEAQGEGERALEAIRRALVLAEPQGFVRIFVDEGLPLARLLYRARSRGIMPEYAGRLLAVFPLSQAARAVPLQGSSASLSERELEVLRYIERGFSNKEIAAAIFVSLRTVKWHTGNIYNKLEVKSRTQAVAKAKALGLLVGIKG